jgi:Glycosyltransferase WbsX
MTSRISFLLLTVTDMGAVCPVTVAAGSRPWERVSRVVDANRHKRVRKSCTHEPEPPESQEVTTQDPVASHLPLLQRGYSPSSVAVSDTLTTFEATTQLAPPRAPLRRLAGGRPERRRQLEDDRGHIEALLPAFADDRYIKIDGRPFSLVYRTSHLPEPVWSAGRTDTGKAPVPYTRFRCATPGGDNSPAASGARSSSRARRRSCTDTGGRPSCPPPQ